MVSAQIPNTRTGIGASLIKRLTILNWYSDEITGKKKRNITLLPDRPKENSLKYTEKRNSTYKWSKLNIYTTDHNESLNSTQQFKRKTGFL